MSSTNSTKKRKAEAKDDKETKVDRLEGLERELLETKKELTKAKETIKDLESKLESNDKEEEEEEVFSDDDDDEEDSTDPWNLKFIELRQFRMINGNCKVAQKGPNPQLGNWLLNQKKAYKNKKLPQERINKLDGLGVVWGKSFPAPVSWEARFEELSKFHGAMGHCNMAMNPTNPSALAKWISAQRVEYKRFKQGRDALLTLDQIGQLNGLGFNWKGPKLN